MITSSKYYNVVFTLNIFFISKKAFDTHYFIFKQIKMNTNILIVNSLKNLNTFQFIKTKNIYNIRVKSKLKILESI